MITFEVSDAPQVRGPATGINPKQFIEEGLLNGPIEQCCDYQATLRHVPTSHPLFGAAYAAFCEHKPLVLSPDMIWITIMQGLANHINLDPEKYRHQFVEHEGKEEIKIRHDGLVKGSPENPWHEVIGMFSAQLRPRILNNVHDYVVCDFSTTDLVERVSSIMVLMDAMQGYFDYRVMTICGIPKVTLEGEPSDWQAIAERVPKLNDYGLDWWTQRLGPVCDEFVKASLGDVDEEHWMNIFQEQSMGSGGPNLFGWLFYFLPYTKDHQTNAPTVVNRMLTQPERRLRKGSHRAGPGASLDTDDIPMSLSKVPFIWEYHGNVSNYEFLAGIIGATESEEDCSIRPKVGWAVRPKPEEQAEQA